MKEYYVVVVSSDPKDSFASETIEGALELAQLDGRETFHVYKTKADDPGWARLGYTIKDFLFTAILMAQKS